MVLVQRWKHKCQCPSVWKTVAPRGRQSKCHAQGQGSTEVCHSVFTELIPDALGLYLLIATRSTVTTGLLGHDSTAEHLCDRDHGIPTSSADGCLIRLMVSVCLKFSGSLAKSPDFHVSLYSEHLIKALHLTGKEGTYIKQFHASRIVLCTLDTFSHLFSGRKGLLLSPFYRRKHRLREFKATANK